MNSLRMVTFVHALLSAKLGLLKWADEGIIDRNF